MKFKVFHNPRCKKSRTGLNYLRSLTTDYDIVDYMKTGLTMNMVKEILLKIHLKPSEIIRKHEEIYKKELKGKSFTDEEWIIIICENPQLLQRPIIVGKHKAILGDPVTNITRLFQNNPESHKP